MLLSCTGTLVGFITGQVSRMRDPWRLWYTACHTVVLVWPLPVRGPTRFASRFSLSTISNLEYTIYCNPFSTREAR